MPPFSRSFLASACLVACIGDSSPIVVSDSGVDSGVDVIKQSDAPMDVVSEPAQEAGPFDANNYPNLELWLAADVGVTVTNSNVSSWTDKSAKQRSVVVPTGDTNCSSGPTVTPSALHALPMVTFNGATECMTVSGAFSDFTGGFTSFVVMEPKSCNSVFTGNAGAVFDTWDNASGYVSGIALGRDFAATPNTSSGDGLLLLTDGTGYATEVEIVGGSSWVPSTPHLLTFHLPASPGGQLVSGLAFVDGTLATLGTNSPLAPGVAASRTTTFIGYHGGTSSGYHQYCGMIGELMVYSKALADADRQTIEAHLKSRWGL